MHEKTPRFDSYRPLHVLRSGGMGTVWEGRLEYPQGLSRPCALKFIHAEHAGNPRYLRRFAKEARIGLDVSTDHPNIVTTRQFGVDPDGQHFLAMDLVVGPTLEDISMSLRGNVLRIRYLAQQILSVLAYLKEREILHCDISSTNILINRDGVVKVVDFGLAKRTQSEASSGNALGALPYVSPEVMLHGRPASYASELYSLGAVLFELLTGRAPYGKGPFTSICHAMKKTDPLTLPETIPPDLKRLLIEPGGLLDRNPASRMSVEEARELSGEQVQVASRAEMSALVVSWLDDKPCAHPPSARISQSNQTAVKHLLAYTKTKPTPKNSADSEHRQVTRRRIWPISLLVLGFIFIATPLLFWSFSEGSGMEPNEAELPAQSPTYFDGSLGIFGR